MKIPKLCKKCKREPKIVTQKSEITFCKCLDRTFFPNELQYPMTHCYYFMKKAEEK